MKWLLFALGILTLWFANRVFSIFVFQGRLIYDYGIPTLFLLLCMSAVGWVSRKVKRKLVQRPLAWIASWTSVGFLIASILAISAWVMNTNIVQNNAGLLWPFNLGLVALDGHPSILVGLGGSSRAELHEWPVLRTSGSYELGLLCASSRTR